MNTYKPAIEESVETLLLQQFGSLIGILGKDIDETQASVIVELLRQSGLVESLANSVYEEMQKDEEFVKNEKALIWLHNILNVVKSINTKALELSSEKQFAKKSASFALEIFQYLDNKNKAN